MHLFHYVLFMQLKQYHNYIIWLLYDIVHEGFICPPCKMQCDFQDFCIIKWIFIYLFDYIKMKVSHFSRWRNSSLGHHCPLTYCSEPLCDCALASQILVVSCLVRDDQSARLRLNWSRIAHNDGIFPASSTWFTIVLIHSLCNWKKFRGSEKSGEKVGISNKKHLWWTVPIMLQIMSDRSPKDIYMSFVFIMVIYVAFIE